MIGLSICALSIACTINANLGLSPWDVLHQGISNKLSISIGTATQVIGFMVIALDVVLGENIGWGSLINIIFVGMLLDIILYFNIVPVPTDFVLQVGLLIVGMLLMGLGMVLYIGSGLGSGPRDGMMVALVKRTNKPVKLVRGVMEIAVLVIGYFLGGTVGIGTVISAFGLGYCLQIIFKLCKFESVKVKHRYIVDDIALLKEMATKQVEVGVEKKEQ